MDSEREAAHEAGPAERFRDGIKDLCVDLCAFRFLLGMIKVMNNKLSKLS